MPLTGPEPCPVRGDYHQWALLKWAPSSTVHGSGTSVSISQGPERALMFCQFCLKLGYLDELVSRG